MLILGNLAAGIYFYGIKNIGTLWQARCEYLSISFPIVCSQLAWEPSVALGGLIDTPAFI